MGTNERNELEKHLVGDTSRFPSSLTECWMTGFQGEECELLFAKYIMENATSLHTMGISFYSNLGRYKFRLMEKLSSYMRASPDCKLLFIWLLWMYLFFILLCNPLLDRWMLYFERYVPFDLVCSFCKNHSESVNHVLVYVLWFCEICLVWDSPHFWSG